MANNSEVSVGYALREKRIKTFITPSLLTEGKSQNVNFQKIDSSLPLIEQGRFDLILHKLEGDDWAHQLAEYEKKYPETVIIDRYENVHRLDDRLEMLQVVSELSEKSMGVPIEAPKQLNIPIETKPSDISKAAIDAGIILPVVAKPTAANGTNNAHQLSLVLTHEALSRLEPPLVLQEFKNHGGVLFKLYVLGDKVMVFKRQSLPDMPTDLVDIEFSEDSKSDEPALPGDGGDLDNAAQVLESSESISTMIKQGAGLIEFNRISNVHMSEDEMNDGRVVDPSPELMQKLGLELSHRLGLQTFNVDILREEGKKDKYYIVDINYMPGYERIPDFEKLFIGFVKTQVANGKSKVTSVEAPSTPYPVLTKKKWKTVRAALQLLGMSR